MANSTKNLVATVGRAPDNTIPIFHQSVAPYHAELYLQDDSLWLFDKTQGMKTWLKIGADQWVRFLQGPVFYSDVLRFAQAPDVQAKDLFNRLNMNLSGQRLGRKCQFCGVPESDKKIASCGSCQGSLVAAVDFDATLNFTEQTGTVPIPGQPPPRQAAPAAPADKAYRKRIRCIVCAAVFLEEVDACPDCGWKHVVYKKGERK